MKADEKKCCSLAYNIASTIQNQTAKQYSALSFQHDSALGETLGPLDMFIVSIYDDGTVGTVWWNNFTTSSDEIPAAVSNNKFISGSLTQSAENLFFYGLMENNNGTVTVFSMDRGSPQTWIDIGEVDLLS